MGVIAGDGSRAHRTEDGPEALHQPFGAVAAQAAAARERERGEALRQDRLNGLAGGVRKDDDHGLWRKDPAQDLAPFRSCAPGLEGLKRMLQNSFVQLGDGMVGPGRRSIAGARRCARGRAGDRQRISAVGAPASDCRQPLLVEQACIQRIEQAAGGDIRDPAPRARPAQPLLLSQAGAESCPLSRLLPGVQLVAREQVQMQLRRLRVRRDAGHGMAPVAGRRDEVASRGSGEPECAHLGAAPAG